MELNGRQKVAAAERKLANKSYATYSVSWKDTEPIMEQKKAANINIREPK